jgi:peptidoglycan/xylan/chitin deacetylase (PgdA/CDA1 family)
MPDAYPRDLTGCGRTPPDPQWPDGAVLAVQLVTNYEEGGESCIVHGDAASEAFLSEIATALQRNPAAMRAMQEADWEIASHGLKWIDYKNFSAAEERADMAEAIRIHTEVTGARPLGWYTGRCSGA